MAKLHNIGFPRIGRQRELKFALEKYWQKSISADTLLGAAKEIRNANLTYQQGLDFIQVGDFSLYDHVLDTSFLLGNIPERFQHKEGSSIDDYFRVARGRSPLDSSCCNTSAGEMTKWFDTNYHYIVPEFSQHTEFSLHAENLIAQVKEAKGQGHIIKPVLLGPVTYLWIGKAKDESNRLELLSQLLPVYAQLLDQLSTLGIEWIQIDEPALVTELPPEWKVAYQYAYQYLKNSKIKLLLATYFGQLASNLTLVSQLPVDGVHLDVSKEQHEIAPILQSLDAHQVLSLGVIDGRNIWKSNLTTLLDLIEPIAEKLNNRLWLAPSCSLLHVPVDLSLEANIPSEIYDWLAFAVQKLEELSILGKGLHFGRAAIAKELAENSQSHVARSKSTQVHSETVKHAVSRIAASDRVRQSPFNERIKVQKEKFNLPILPTTTIGSFPQTANIRKTRRDFKQGNISEQQYNQQIKAEIKECIAIQEKLGLDVFVHGEAERNDMVEYFGEQLSGFVFSQYGWVQSYGSRCVKPPIIFGDVSRSDDITVNWLLYAKSLTNKPLKGMLTGPVTMLNWSFVRDDQPRQETCTQIALAIKEEVLALERAGIDMIQIDEAALSEGLPLKRSQWQNYLTWAIDSFKLCANSVKDLTQIHTHMCYSEFNDIIGAIANMDADVITIETSRSDMELLGAFDKFSYPNQIGPGVYDIHSPNIPKVDDMVDLINKASDKISIEQLWLNPDCGLKTRSWQEVVPALENMVEAAKILRTSL